MPRRVRISSEVDDGRRADRFADRGPGERAAPGSAGGTGHCAAVRPAEPSWPEGDQVRLRHRPVRGVPGAGRRPSAYSCDTPLWAVLDKEITTVEGLGTADQPHPVTQALIAGQAAQCGYCLSGVTIAAVELLSRNDDPSDEEVRAALDRNLCRCGAHNRIVRAVLAAAAELRAGRGDAAEPARGTLRCRPRSRRTRGSATGSACCARASLRYGRERWNSGRACSPRCPRWPPRNWTSASPGFG